MAAMDGQAEGRPTTPRVTLPTFLAVRSPSDGISGSPTRCRSDSTCASTVCSRRRRPLAPAARPAARWAGPAGRRSGRTPAPPTRPAREDDGAGERRRCTSGRIRPGGCTRNPHRNASPTPDRVCPCPARPARRPPEVGHASRHAKLEDVIDQVAASYGAGRLIDSLSSAQLPNKRQVIDALNHLKAVDVPRLLRDRRAATRRSCATPSRRTSIPRYEILCEQIARAVNYEGFRTAAGARDRRTGRARRTLRLLGRLPDLRTLLSKDVLAAFQGDPAANSVEEVIFSYPSIEAITVHRIAHELLPRGRADAAAHHVRARALAPRESTSIPARRSASRSSSTTGPAS